MICNKIELHLPFLIKRGEFGHRDTREQCHVETGRGWSDVTASQGLLAPTGCWEEAWIWFFLRALRRDHPCQWPDIRSLAPELGREAWSTTGVTHWPWRQGPQHLLSQLWAQQQAPRPPLEAPSPKVQDPRNSPVLPTVLSATPPTEALGGQISLRTFILKTVLS